MEVVADRDLFNFIDGLDGEKEEEKADSLHVSTGYMSDVWSDIESAFDNWTQCVLYAKSKHCRSGNLSKSIVTIGWIFNLSR